jgi:ribosomal protein S18 acetylase RimI-like enzyme
MNFHLERIVEFHAEQMGKADFPCNLNIDDISQQIEARRFFPTASDPMMFFMIDNRLQLKGLEFPVIKHLTVLKPLSEQDINNFISYLRKLSDRFLLLIESYNKDCLAILPKLHNQETFFCQQKYLCHLKDLGIIETGPPDGITIRNFIPGRDEDRYADFYNQVLGFLAGKPVERSFVDEIVKRKSFDPSGYFIAEENGRMVGFMSIEKEPWGERGSGFGYIYQIGVAEPMRGSGLAEVLLEKARDFAVEQGLNRIGVGVRKSNTPAVRFFKKHGFDVAYEVTGYLIST